MGLWGAPSNRSRQTRQTGTFKRCPSFGGCGGTGRARGMGASGAKCAKCGGSGQVRK